MAQAGEPGPAGRARTLKVLLLGDHDAHMMRLWEALTHSGSQGEGDKPHVGVDFGTMNVDVGGEPVRLQVWHTAGQERFRSITAGYYRGGHIFLVCFNVANKKSFANTNFWLAEAEAYGPEAAEKLIVGIDGEVMLPREVEFREARELGEAAGVPCLETRVDHVAGLERAVHDMAERVLSRQSRFALGPAPPILLGPHHGAQSQCAC